MRTISEIRKFIFLTGKVETLSYFSLAIKEELEKKGFSCFVFEFEKEFESFMKLTWFADEESCLFTFNFIGLSGEEVFEGKDGRTFWEERGVACVNYLVDHPAYYQQPMSGRLPKRYVQFCVDKEHERYTKRFFPKVKYSAFLPLAGSRCKRPLPYEEREIKVMFAGNYTPLETFTPYINRLGESEAAFYREILNHFITCPDTPLGEGLEFFFRRDFPEIKEREMRDAVVNSLFIDLYIRFYFRGLVIKTLAESGIPVDVYGSGWELLPCEGKENILIHGAQKTEGCLQAMGQAQISLNCMPWFKEGSHDRIYSSMLCGAVAVTDKSRYLTEKIKTEAVFYDLKELKRLPEQINELLNKPEKARKTAAMGQQYAQENHTWENRIETILAHLKIAGLF